MSEVSDVLTLRALSALLTYPRRELLDALPEIDAALAASMLLDAARKQRLRQLTAHLRTTDPFELEESYVALFDTGRSTSLWLFEHVHGESRDRGQAMVDLRNVYERAGFHLASNELPDYLPAVLEYLSYRELPEVRDMLGDCAHILRTVGERLAGRSTLYATVFDALLCVAEQAGFDWPAAMTSAPTAPEPVSPLDEEWMEPAAFGPGSHSSPTASSPVGPCCPAASPGPPQERGEQPLRYMPRNGRGAGLQS